MIVIDASTLAKYILKERNWTDVKEYLKMDVYSIDHILKEVANSIWKHTFIFHRFSLEEGRTAFMVLLRICRDILVFEREEDYLDSAFKIAMEMGISIYDALYIAQADKYGALLTSDEKQRDVAQRMGIKTYFIR